MILERFYDRKLAQASYLVGCAKTGEACVIDPYRDVEVYLAAAAAQGLRIVAVTETHIHADFVSGSRELAERSGAQLFLSDEGPADWKYGFADQPNVTLVRGGDTIRLGNVRLDVIHTPGHTPEHISFLLTDEATSAEPQAIFSGDFVFVGDVGRPDLLERAAGFEGTMEAGARVLFQSLEDFKKLPDSLMIWPAHGAGSACGKSLGGVPVSTLGYERAANWGMRFDNADAFAEAVLEGQPEPPRYFKEMKRINKVGPPILGGFAMPPRLSGALERLLDAGTQVVDIRSEGSIAAGFIPGTLGIPLDGGFTTWAGWLLDYGKPIALLAETEEQVAQAVRDLQKIGLDAVIGWFGTDALRDWERAHAALETLTLVPPAEAAQSGAKLVDLRGLNEYRVAHIPGAVHLPLGYLEAQWAGFDEPVVLHCMGGSRSVIGATVLRRLGVPAPKVLAGGLMDWMAAGLPTESIAPACV